MTQKKVKVKLNAEFGQECPDSAVVGGFAPWPEGSVQESLVPNKKYFHFSKHDLKRILLAIKLNMTFTLFGPTGCGKTEILEQIAARLNWPFVLVSHHKQMFFEDLLSKDTLLDGSTDAEMGALPTAMMFDAMYVADEFNLATAGSNAGYHSVMGNRTLVLTPSLAMALFGQADSAGKSVIHASEGFRFFMTANGGFSADGGTYKGTQNQNGAFRDRPAVHQMRYLPKEQEIKMLLDRFPKLAKSVSHAEHIERCVELANDLRASHEASEFDVPVSTRTLISLLTIFEEWGGNNEAVAESWDMALAGKLEDEDKALFAETFHNNFNKEWTAVCSEAGIG